MSIIRNICVDYATGDVFEILKLFHELGVNFNENYYYKFDEHKMMVEGSRRRITDSFKDVYDLDTAFTYTNGITYFFKNESYYEFDNSKMRLNRMKPGISANYFMNCNVPPIVGFAARFDDDDFNDNVERTTGIIDYIDLGAREDMVEVDCNNPERAVPCEKDSANSIKSFSFLAWIESSLLVALIRPTQLYSQNFQNL